MFDFLKRLLGKKNGSGADKSEFSEEQYRQYADAKEKALESILGPMHDIVGHSLLPFFLGGFLDSYYFANGIPGTGVATMELIEPDGTGPKPNRIGTYELVAFTKHRGSIEKGDDESSTTYKAATKRINSILNPIARYSYDAVLNPGETVEFPSDDEEEQAPCLVFDDYAPLGHEFIIQGRKHCLLLVIEIFRSEMEYAMANGSAALFNKLKAKGYYPYSDMDREPVV